MLNFALFRLGSCWAFSTVGNIEGQLAIQKSRLVELSVEQLIECDSFHDRKHSDCGVFGGWPYLAFEYIIQAGGIKSERDYPYCSGIPYGDPGFCVPCMPKNYVADLCGNHSDLYCKPSGTLGQTPNGFCTKVTDPEASLSTWKAVSSDEDEIAATLATTGPLSVLMNANFLQFYKSGIYNPFSCDKSSLDHAVLLVGYGTSRGKDYWIVKNSWGEKWGEKGYFRILRGKGTCGINTAVTTSILSSQESKTSKAIL